MTDRELRKLKRGELLEMMIEQGRMVAALRQELEQQQQLYRELEGQKLEAESQVERLRKRLDDKDAEMEEVSERLKAKLDGKDLQLADINTRLKAKLDDKDAQLDHLKEKLDDKDVQLGRLKAKLDDKDAQMAHLMRRLDRKDIKIRSLQETLEAEGNNQVIVAEEAGSIAEAALKLNQVFEAAQAAADQYLYNIRRMYGTAGDDATQEADAADSDAKE